MVHVRNGQFGRVLDRDDALVTGDAGDQSLGQRRLARTGRAGNDDVRAAKAEI